VVDLNSLDSYDFHLPEGQIAQAPAEPRDSSRLLVLHRAERRWEHRIFRELPEYLGSSDLLVVNNTRVLRARLRGKRLMDDGTLGGKIEFLMLEEIEPGVWEGAFHSAAKHKPGIRFEIPTPSGEPLRGELVRGASESPHGLVRARFDRDPVASGAGEMPLPPYIKRAAGLSDEERYQTIYAGAEAGSAAAPTAGLHFTSRVRETLAARGVGWAEVTLNVGLGTFRPVKAGDVREHVMHEEKFSVSESVAREITFARQAGKRVVAVGTTAVRTLESAWSREEGRLVPGTRRTSLFIRPGAYEFQVVGGLLTNFHLPKSTLLMLVCAFAGRELMLRAYEEAVREGYRFFSYGDAMLIL
jgi:S-adenosylmethionine:tRNA ribosyltransferase-isomerase